MKNLRTSWKLIALFALGAIGSVFYVTRSRAFTLIEVQYLPAVQLVASQSADVKVSNVTSNNLDVVISTFNDAGNMISQKSETILPFQTATVTMKAGAGGPLRFRTTVALGTANSSVSDVMVFDKVSGQVIALLGGVILPNQ